MHSNPQTEQMDEQQLEQLKILIVDDDSDLLESLSLVLSSCGYQVICADSGAKGLSLMKTQAFDLILADLRMPRMDGHQFLRIAKLADPDCRVVMMSAYATAEAVVKDIREGVYDYLLKPFKLAELQDILRKIRGRNQSATRQKPGQAK